MSLEPPRIATPKITQGMKATADERKSVWVSFPHLASRYMLPLVQQGRKLVPIFYEDGSVGVESKDRDPELAKLVDEFVFSISREDAKAQNVMVGLSAYGAFIKLVKAFLLANYNYTDEQLAPLLTMTPNDFAIMYKIIFDHCFGR
jgi:hypothetical protein